MSAKVIKNKVKTFRETYPWSVTELAKRASVVPQTISKMEKGLPTSRNSQLKVSKALGKEHEEVFPADGK